MLSDTAALVERVSYDAYGMARHHHAADINGDGAVTQEDYDMVTQNLGNFGVGNITRTGTVGSRDQALANDSLAALPPGELSKTDNIVGYAGYLFNAEIHGAGMYTVRHRHYSPELGRWLTRDPIGYVDGMNLYEYVRGNASNLLDSLGLMIDFHRWCDPMDGCNPPSRSIPPDFMPRQVRPDFFDDPSSYPMETPISPVDLWFNYYDCFSDLCCAECSQWNVVASYWNLSYTMHAGFDTLPIPTGPGMLKKKIEMPNRVRELLNRWDTIKDIMDRWGDGAGYTAVCLCGWTQYTSFERECSDRARSAGCIIGGTLSGPDSVHDNMTHRVTVVQKLPTDLSCNDACHARGVPRHRAPASRRTPICGQ